MTDLFDSYTLDESIPAVEYGGECPGMFETYGNDLKTIQSIAEKHPRRVWTLVDGDDGSSMWLNGYRRVNRVLYAVTTTDGQPDEMFEI